MEWNAAFKVNSLFGYILDISFDFHFVLFYEDDVFVDFITFWRYFMKS